MTISWILLVALLTGWVANDAWARNRRWIAWGVMTSLFSVLAAIIWLIVRRRSPRVHERRASLVAKIFTAALCLVILERSAFLVIRTFGYEVARVEGTAMTFRSTNDTSLLNIRAMRTGDRRRYQRATTS